MIPYDLRRDVQQSGDSAQALAIECRQPVAGLHQQVFHPGEKLLEERSFPITAPQLPGDFLLPVFMMTDNKFIDPPVRALLLDGDPHVKGMPIGRHDPVPGDPPSIDIMQVVVKDKLIHGLHQLEVADIRKEIGLVDRQSHVVPDQPSGYHTRTIWKVSASGAIWVLKSE